MAFTHLHVHSEYSLLDGLANIKELVDTAAEMGMNSLALTDHGSMFGIIEFYKAAKKKGIKPIIGCEVYTAARSLHDKDSVLDRVMGHLVLLAETDEGYQNLIKIVSEGYVNGLYYKPRIDKKTLAEHSKGLIALSACLAGDVPRKLLADDYEGAKKEALEYQSIFGKDNFFLEVQYQGLEEEEKILKPLRKLSDDTGIPLVATNDIHYVKKEHATTHDVLLCIQTGKKLSDKDRMRFTGDQFYFRSEDEMKEALPDFHDAIGFTQVIADRCHAEIDFSGRHLPEFISPDGKTNKDYLRELCDAGLEYRYGADKEKYRERLEHELGIIEGMGFVEYFLIVWDFIKYAKDRDIPVGPGRGSAAGSIVSYVLRITDIDPIKYGLIFERFLNPERVSMPDIDIDFCEDRRGEVIDYVKEKYGEEKVAQIITFGTLKAKAVVRDVGRVLDIPLDKVNRIAGLIPNELGIDLESAIQKEPKLRKAIAEDDETAQLFDYAKILEGKSRHAGTHAAGVVITKKPLDEYVPLFNSKNGVSTQFTMTTVEQLGLLKMDFLGLRNLTVIEDALRMIEEDHGIRINFDEMDYDDEEAYKVIANGNTDGVFQLEGGGMQEFMKKMRPTTFEDVVAGISIYRPGPMQFIPTYLANKKNPKGIKYTDPSLEPILSVTAGVMIYQEQVMQIVRDLAGYDYGRSDEVRRAMSKKKEDVMLEQRKYFVHGLKSPDGKRDVPGCVANGIPEKAADKIFDDMIDFASYAFNKSHAAAYAVVSYRTAYLKAHYPAEFMAALMTSFMGGDGEKIAKYIRNCLDMGIEILPPCVLKSGRKFTVEDGKIRMGLRSVKNAGEGAIDAILALRESGIKIGSMREFVDNIDLSHFTSKAAESLINAGAFDAVLPNRASALNMYRLYSEQAKKEKNRVIEGQATLFDMIASDTKQTEEDLMGEDYPKRKRLALEKDVLGIYMSGHPLDDYKWIIDEISNTTSAEINNPDDYPDRKAPTDVIIVGMISNAKVFLTKKGKTMAVLLLEDLQGLIKVLVFHKVFEKTGDDIREGAIVVVRGKEELRPGEEPTIIASKVTPIEVVEEFFRKKKEREIETLA